MKQRLKLEELLPMYTFLYSDEFEAYCKNPFDVAAKKAFLENFKVPVMAEGNHVAKKAHPAPLSGILEIDGM